jgi:hypothetical protein
MKASTSILVYGHNPALSSSRCATLHKAGFHAFPASNLNEVQALCSKQSIGLVVFCHSISPDEAKMVGFVALAFNPSTFVLPLNEIDPAIGDHAGCNAAGDRDDIECLAGSGFLTAVKKAVR